MTNIVRVTAHYSNHKSIHIQVTIASIESKTSSNEMSLNESKNYSLQNNVGLHTVCNSSFEPQAKGSIAFIQLKLKKNCL